MAYAHRSGFRFTTNFLETKCPSQVNRTPKVLDLPFDKVEMIMERQKHVINNTLSKAAVLTFQLLLLDRALALALLVLLAVQLSVDLVEVGEVVS